MLLIAFGTRPEYIKVKSIIDNYKGDKKILFTGQHKDLCKDVDFDIQLEDNNTSESRLDNIFMNVLGQDKVFEDVTHVLVQGDTSSVVAVALASFNRGIKIIHLEAGLRTYDKQNPFPEESNRRIVSSIADYHLCPTENNKQNLINEKIKDNIYVVGNTGLDNIDRSGIKYGNKILVTLHRRENHHWIDKFFKEINELAKDNRDLEFYIPLHPNPNVQKHKHILTDVKIIDPLPHKELIDLVKECRFVISDSGGLQEECSFLNKKIIVCRKVTERPETIGTNSIICYSPEDLNDIFLNINEDYKIDVDCPYGDGNSVEKIIIILNKIIK